jgi:hypothetical protein
VYHDYSCYRDKVNRAASQRTGVMPARTTVRSGGVFAGATYKLHLDMKLPPHLPGLTQKPRHRDPNDLTVVRAGADGN